MAEEARVLGAKVDHATVEETLPFVGIDGEEEVRAKSAGVVEVGDEADDVAVEGTLPFVGVNGEAELRVEPGDSVVGMV
jgi:hypothetical protein